MKFTNGTLLLEQQKNIKTTIENLTNQVMGNVPFNDRSDFSVKAETEVDNSDNQIVLRLTKMNSHYRYNVNTLTAGILTIDEFLDLIAYIVDKGLDLLSESEPWLTPEVAEGLLDIRERIHSNKITKGMQNSNKNIGRPSDDEQIQLAIEMYRSGNYTGEQIAKMAGISRSTLYRHLNKTIK